MLCPLEKWILPSWLSFIHSLSLLCHLFVSKFSLPVFINHQFTKTLPDWCVVGRISVWMTLWMVRVRRMNHHGRCCLFFLNASGLIFSGLVHKLSNHTTEFGATDALCAPTGLDLLLASGYDLDNGLGIINGE